MALLARLSLPVLLCVLLWPPAGQAQSILSVDEIIGLLKAGVSEEVILYKVRQAPEGLLELSSEEMVRLREAGASDKFILGLLKATGETALSPNEQRANLQQVSPSGATLLLYSVPAGAQVVLDGVPVGTTPYLGNQLEGGQHELYISKRFYRPVVKTITAKIGDRLELTERLELELPSVAVSLSTKDLPRGNRWTVRGMDGCSASQFLPVEREDSEDGRVVLRSRGAQRYGSTCLEVYFWIRASAGAGGEAPEPDVVFRVEDVPLQPTSLAELDLVVARDANSPTGLRCSIASGPGRLMRATGF